MSERARAPVQPCRVIIGEHSQPAPLERRWFRPVSELVYFAGRRTELDWVRSAHEHASKSLHHVHALTVASHTEVRRRFDSNRAEHRSFNLGPAATRQ